MLNTIKDSLQDIKTGKLVIVLDSKNRENEGDLVISAEKATYDAVNFMSLYGRGLICVPITEKRARHLSLPLMVNNGNDNYKTSFTISVDSISTSTGISIADRLRTIIDIADETKNADDFKKPGHIFPLIAKEGGVLQRQGHTEAAIDLSILAGLGPTSVICEILNKDGTTAKLKDLLRFSQKHRLKIISIADLVEYKKRQIVNRVVETKLPTKYGTFRIIVYLNSLDKSENVALIKGNIENEENVLVRLHSECFTGDVLASKKCDCREQLLQSMKNISEKGRGVILYLKQEGRGVGLINKLKAYKLQSRGFDTVEANIRLGFKNDMRDYKTASLILKDLGVNSVNLLTNNPLKILGLKNNGIKVLNRTGLEIAANEENKKYLKIKKEKMGHLLRNV
jgi:3,4-dihydroxy 2-butanone 4-phosphate synthase/GTP cyclohydrolase II